MNALNGEKCISFGLLFIDSQEQYDENWFLWKSALGKCNKQRHDCKNIEFLGGTIHFCKHV